MTEATHPTPIDLLDALNGAGHLLDAFEICAIQGVLIRWHHPGDLLHSEVIERHYTPDVEASPEVCDVTMGRAIQRVLWAIAGDVLRAAEGFEKSRGGSNG